MEAAAGGRSEEGSSTQQKTTLGLLLCGLGFVCPCLSGGISGWTPSGHRKDPYGTEFVISFWVVSVWSVPHSPPEKLGLQVPSFKMVAATSQASDDK